MFSEHTLLNFCILFSLNMHLFRTLTLVCCYRGNCIVQNEKLFANFFFHWILITSKQRETEYENAVFLFITYGEYFFNCNDFDSGFMQSRNFIRSVYSKRNFFNALWTLRPKFYLNPANRFRSEVCEQTDRQTLPALNAHILWTLLKQKLEIHGCSQACVYRHQ